MTNAADDGRTGWYSDQPALAPATVSGSGFGQLFSANVTGQVYAQPLVSNNTLFVATEANNVYALDPETGAQRWTKNLGPAFDANVYFCVDVYPTVGVTGTPVIDPATNTAYLFSKRYLTGTSGPGAWYAHAFDLANGNERPNFPVRIQGTASNDASQVFDESHQLQRPGLLLMNGVVYAAFGAHCDRGSWAGWIAGVSTAGTLKTLWTTQAGPNKTDGGGIWQSGGGLVSDGSGSIFFATGNGGSPVGPIPGNTPPGALGQSVIHTVVQADGSLKSTDFFAPYDAAGLDGWDADLSSAAPMALPSAYFGTATYPHLLVQTGKQGYVYLLNRDNLGGIGNGAGGSDAVLGRFGMYGGVWSRPSAWGGDGGYVYITSASGGTGPGLSGFLRAYKYGLDGTGKPTLSLAATSTDQFGFGSGAPIVTSNGTTSGTAVMWVIWSPDTNGVGGQLRAYDAVPTGGAFHQLYSAPLGTVSKFASPGVGTGRLYVGTRDGKILAFGAPNSQPLTASPVTFPTTVVGTTSAATATLTATTTVTINALASSSSIFGVGAVTLPATLTAGQSLSVPVTFTPSVVGLAAGQLNVTSSAGAFSVALSGTGQSAAANLTASVPAISFGNAAIGNTVTSSVILSNTGAQALTISSVTLPGAPFGATGAPAAGATIAGGGSLTVTLSFAPIALGSYNGAFAVVSSGGSISVPLTGTATLPQHLTLSPLTVTYADTTVGASVSGSFTVTNDGGSPLTITKSKPPAGIFTATTTLNEGTTIAAGTTLTETVTFAPTAAGAASATWAITGDDSSGPQQVTFQGNGISPPDAGTDAGPADAGADTGTGSGTIPSPIAGGWQLNGSAAIVSSTLQLTAATSGQAGCAFWPTPVSSANLTASFDVIISAGGGADGLTLVLADATRATPTQCGISGGGLGFATIPGFAVGFDTYKSSTAPSANFVGISDGPTATQQDVLHWVTTSTNVPTLHGATHHAVVTTSGGVLNLSVDGVQVISQALTLPPNVLVGFTGGTGGLADAHSVANVSIATVPLVPVPTLTLTCSATPCTPNDTLTAAFTNMPGNVNDWIAIIPQGAPSTQYAQFKTTGGAVNGSVTFTNPPGGTTLIARAFSNGTYNQVGTDTAPITIAASTVSPSVSPTCSASPCTAGSSISVAFSAMPAHAWAWVAIAASGSPDTTDVAWSYTGGAVSGTKVFANLPPGTYVARGFADDGFVKVAESAPFTITQANGTTLAMTCSATPCTSNDTLTVAFTNMPGNNTDWIAIVAQGAPATEFAQYRYTGGLVNGSVTFAGPPGGVTLVARAFANGTYTQVGTDSAPLTISASGTPASVTVTCSASPCVAGSTLTVAYANVPANAMAWVALATAGSADTTDVAWSYTGGTVSGARAFANIPAGSYVGRAFQDNGFTKIAQSATITVTP